MKKALLIVTLSLFCIAVKAQKKDSASSQKNDTTTYFNVEVEPTFPGGMMKLFQFIAKNFKNNTDYSGRVGITFVVEKDGTLSNIHVTKSLSEEADKEAIRVMSKCPKWIPGMQGSRPVRVAYTVPIIIN